MGSTPELGFPHIIQSPPKSDIWRKPTLPFPHNEQFDAPSTLVQSVPLSALRSVKVTFSGEWEQKFDQGGILLVIQHPGQRRSWIKAGVEYFNSEPQISFVGCDRWADWSIGPCRAANAAQGAGIKEQRVTILLEIEDQTLWAYELVTAADGRLQKHPFRECTWPFDDVQAKVVDVSCYACSPTPDGPAGRDALKVTFHGVEIETE